MRKASAFIKRYWSYSIALLLFAGCAQMIPPSGGPKDVIPPKVVEYLPENKSIHFNKHKILITFDEYVQLKNLSTQLITSPPLKRVPQVLLRGKTMEITFTDTLANNTTYTFNFGNAISDNNEGNELKNFQYVFSTGDFLDSLSLTGNIQDGLTHEPCKQAMVMLYADLSDSAPYKVPPSYVGLANDQGNYKIENIKVGTYRAISLSKSQGDYVYHPYGEEIGFAQKPIAMSKNDTVNFLAFTEIEPKLILRKAKVIDKGEIGIVFNKPADSIKIVPLNLAANTVTPYTYLRYSATHDTVTYWTNNPFLDSLRFIVYRNNQILDTAFVHGFPGNLPIDKKKPKPTKIHFITNTGAREGFDFHYPIVLQFDGPVLKHNFSKIHFKLKSVDSLGFSIDTTGLPMSLSIKPIKPLQSDTVYTLQILSGAFFDMYGGTNDTTILHFGVLEPTYFGTLKLKLSFATQGTFLVQLLDNGNNIYRQQTVTGNTSIFFDALPPGSYRVRVVQDDNNNGKWDAGDFMKGRQPEKVFYYNQAITIRSNWDLAQSWEVK